MQTHTNRSDNDETAPSIETEGTAPAASARANGYRERFLKAQAIAAQVARARAAGGTPSEEQAARLVAEFHARGGQVTNCPASEEAASGTE